MGETSPPTAADWANAKAQDAVRRVEELERRAAAAHTTATVTLCPDFSKEFEQMVRDIVVDEVTKQMDAIALRITQAIAEQSTRFMANTTYIRDDEGQAHA